MPDGIGDLAACRCTWGFPGCGRRGACGMDDELRLLGVSGEVSGLMDAYRLAVRRAARVRAGLIAAGVDPKDLSVVPGLGEAGEPVVHVTVLPVVAVELSALIAGEPNPSPGRPPHHPCPRDDPNAA
jgi:hypothetical protein